MTKKYQKWVQILIFQVYMIINSLYIKRSSQFCVFVTFLTTLSNLGIFLLILARMAMTCVIPIQGNAHSHHTY